MSDKPGGKFINLVECWNCNGSKKGTCWTCNGTGKVEMGLLNGCGNCHYNVSATCHRHAPIFIDDGRGKKRVWPTVSKKYYFKSTNPQDSDWCGDWETHTEREETR